MPRRARAKEILGKGTTEAKTGQNIQTEFLAHKKELAKDLKKTNDTVSELNKENLTLKKRFDEYMKREEEEHDYIMALEARIKELELAKKFDPNHLNWLGRLLFKILIRKQK